VRQPSPLLFWRFLSRLPSYLQQGTNQILLKEHSSGPTGRIYLLRRREGLSRILCADAKDRVTFVRRFFTSE
jgi:hypothetical protein